MWKIDPKDNYIHKDKHDHLHTYTDRQTDRHTHTHIYHIFATVGLFEGTGDMGREEKERE
jgi:hypothetical protein